MMSSPDMPLKSLRILMVEDLAWCTELPDGLSQLPYLEFFQIDRASAIKRVGHEFLQSCHDQNPHPSWEVVAFPRLHTMKLLGMVEWEEWKWEEQVQAFPALKELILFECKLRHLPPGLASYARALNVLSIRYAQGIISLDNFPSLVELELYENLDLERITNLTRLQKLIILSCPKLKVLEGVPALHRLVLQDVDMETLPEYMGGVNPRHLELYCTLALLVSMAAKQSGPEWYKFSHVEHVKAYAQEGDNMNKWYVLYTAHPCNMETNVSRSFMSRGTLSSFEDTQRFESIFKMTRKTFSYICSLVYVPSFKDMNRYSFVDSSVMCLEDRVAVALKRLYSNEPQETLGSSIRVNESTIMLVTESFVHAVWERAMHHVIWPDSSEIDNIKSLFDKMHNMCNCCGVICTTLIPFGPNCNNEKNDNILTQVVVDPEMRFTNMWLGSADSMNRLSILHNSKLFKECEKGDWLNGSKLKGALDGSEIGEYIIGDSGYPLLPWLITPYQEEDLSDSNVEFNRRHSAATTCAPKALARLQDTWKFLQGDAWWHFSPGTLGDVISACFILHNIVIEMEDDAAMPRVKGTNYCEDVRQLENEDAVSSRDMLLQYFLTSMPSESGGRVDAVEDHDVVSSGSGDEEQEQEVQTRTEDEERHDGRHENII